MQAVQTERAKLREMVDKIRGDLERKAGRCLRSVEWGGVPLAHRMAVLLMAGIDGDLQDLARKAWAEFTPAEKNSVGVAMRSLHASLHACNALRARA